MAVNWMTEAKMRSIVVKMLRSLAAFPVENSVAQGQADVSCVAGWIELKVTQRPLLADQVVSIDMRPSQRVWHRKWRRHGGRAWTLTRVNGVIPSWYLHDGAWAADHLGLTTEDGMRESCIRYWNYQPDGASLAEALCLI